jgi:hypothetical protein
MICSALAHLDGKQAVELVNCIWPTSTRLSC